METLSNSLEKLSFNKPFSKEISIILVFLGIIWEKCSEIYSFLSFPMVNPSTSSLINCKESVFWVAMLVRTTYKSGLSK